MVSKANRRGKSGFIATGQDGRGGRFKIFAQTYEGAREIETAAGKSDWRSVTMILMSGR
jgi:hypothetical protein